MRLAGIKPGDIVRVDGSLAFVREVGRHQLVIAWHGRESIVRTVSARAVTEHWRKVSDKPAHSTREMRLHRLTG